MIVVKDIVGFIKKPDNFVLQNPRKAILYSVIFKIIGISLLIINSGYLLAFAISSFSFLTASIYIDNKILKNIEPLFFQLIEKGIKHNPDKAGFYMGRIFCMMSQSSPLSRVRGFYRGFFFQKEN